MADGDGAAPAAVVGTGLDVVYPDSNAKLWEQVVARGVVFSESPLGTLPRPRVFPARNRIIAALSDVVVVVESHYGGGYLYTVDARGPTWHPSGAGPGSVRSRASDGTNGLLVDGCIPIRDATDVLVAISLARSGVETPTPDLDVATRLVSNGWRPGTTNRPSAGKPDEIAGSAPSEAGRSVLDAVDDTPTSFETILLRTGLSFALAAEACEDLVEAGRLLAGAGWWSKR